MRKVKEASLAADTTPQAEDKKGVGAGTGAPAPVVQTQTQTQAQGSRQVQIQIDAPTVSEIRNKADN